MERGLVDSATLASQLLSSPLVVTPALFVLLHFQPDALLSLTVSHKYVPLLMLVPLTQLPVCTVRQVRG